MNTFFYDKQGEFNLLGTQIATDTRMSHMFQFAVLACFTLLYSLIALVLAVRVCAPLIKNWSAAPESLREKGKEEDPRHVSSGKTFTGDQGWSAARTGSVRSKMEPRFPVPGGTHSPIEGDTC